jgi:hypothetical protein
VGYQKRVDGLGPAEAEALCCSRRGISALTGLALCIEIGDWSRYTRSAIGAVFMDTVHTARWQANSPREHR